MATCGYLCPKCEGRGFTDDGISCDWCTVSSETKEHNKIKAEDPADLSDADWITQVHGKCSCSDIGAQDA